MVPGALNGRFPTPREGEVIRLLSKARYPPGRVRARGGSPRA